MPYATKRTQDGINQNYPLIESQKVSLVNDLKIKADPNHGCGQGISKLVTPDEILK